MRSEGSIGCSTGSGRAVCTSISRPRLLPAGGRCAPGACKLAGVDFRRLGWSEIEVSEISLGSWLTYSGGVAEAQARACVAAAFEAGINFFDTANVYGRGAAENLLGEDLSERHRDR